MSETRRGLRAISRNPLRGWSGRPDSNRRRPAWEYPRGGSNRLTASHQSRGYARAMTSCEAALDELFMRCGDQFGDRRSGDRDMEHSSAEKSSSPRSRPVLLAIPCSKCCAPCPQVPLNEGHSMALVWRRGFETWGVLPRVGAARWPLGLKASHLRREVIGLKPCLTDAAFSPEFSASWAMTSTTRNPFVLKHSDGLVA